MPRIGSSRHGESNIRMLRVMRRGDRHDPRELTVSFRFEGDFAPAFREGRADGLIPGEALRNIVHRTVREVGSAEIEELGITLCERLLADHPALTRARIEVTERSWMRLDAGGRAQNQAFMAGPPEVKTAAVTSNGSRVSVTSGLDGLSLMRTWGFAPAPDARPQDGTTDGLQRIFVAGLSARWSYRSPDVTFRAFRQGVRAALIETFSWHRGRSVHHTLYAMADVVLATYEEIADVTLSVRERPYRPADLFAAGMENPDDLFVALDEPLGTVDVTVEREP